LPSPSPPPPLPPQQPFVVGDLVFVEHRTWPGMNKHGGVAFVTAVVDPPGTSYDVKYTVGHGVDRGVEARYVHAYVFPEESVGVRSRRGRETRGRAFSGGSSGSVRRPVRPKARPRAPAISAAAGAGDVARSESVVDAAASSAAATATVPRSSPPRHAAGSGGVPGNTAAAVAGKEDQDRGGAASAVAAAPAAPAGTADAIADASASSPGADLAPPASEGSWLRRRDDDLEVSGDDDAGEVSSHSDAASTIREDDAEGAGMDASGFSSDDGVGGVYGGGSYDGEHGDDGYEPDPDHGPDAAASDGTAPGGGRGKARQGGSTS